jgi:hypothetical protein
VQFINGGSTEMLPVLGSYITGSISIESETPA